MDLWRSPQRIGAEAASGGSTGEFHDSTAGRPQRCLDFQGQDNPERARCQRITVSGRTIARRIRHLGKQSADTSQYQSVTEYEGGLLGRVRRSTLICSSGPEFLPQAQLATAAGRSPFQRSVCTNPDIGAAASPDFLSTASRTGLRTGTGLGSLEQAAINHKAYPLVC